MTVPGSDNIPSTSNEWSIYWHGVVTVFKKFKEASAIQVVAQPLAANESVLRFIDKNKAKVDKPAPSSQQLNLFIYFV